MSVRPVIVGTAITALLAAGLGALATADAGIPARTSDPAIKVVARMPAPGGTDLEFFSRALTRYKDASGRFVTSRKPVMRHFAVVGNEKSNTRIIDITKPTAPFLAAEIPCTLVQGDIQLSEKRSIILIANDSSGANAKCPIGDERPMPPGAAVVSIKDIYRPTVIAAAPAVGGAHNMTLRPDGRYLYISTSEIVQGTTTVPIYDLANPAAPKLVSTFATPGNAPHDIRFNRAGTRAYFAGVSTYRIVDTTNPVAPVVISTFFPPGATIGHDTLVTDDGAFLFAGDEAGGGATYPCPGGAIHVYDIRNEKAPIWLGASYAAAGPVTNRTTESSEPGGVGSCTAHVMELNPDRKSMTLGWYSAGSRVFDFHGLYDESGKPKTTASLAYGARGVGLVESAWAIPTGAVTWSAKQYAKVPGFIFADDLVLGFYVVQLPKR